MSDNNNFFFGGNFGFGSNPGGNGDGPGGFGDFFNQLSAMFGGGADPGNGAVNYELAERIARQQIGNQPAIKESDTTAVQEAVRLADMWLDSATVLPTGSGKVEAWNAETWLTSTLPTWKRFVTPVAERMNEAQLEQLPEQAREMVGPMLKIMNSMSGMNFGMQLGHALGDLAKQTLTGSDFGLPLAPAGVTAILPQHLAEMSKDLSVPQQEALVYLCAREAARQRLFKHVPWLVERLVSSVEEYAAGLVIDTSHIEEATRELGLESGDPAQIQEAMQRLQGMDLSPRITSRNAGAVARLETLLALVEGWVELVVTQAMGERVPSTAAMNEAWRRRRATGGSAEKAFAKVVGIEFAAPKVAEAEELWRRVENAVGLERRDAVWDHPDFLPSAEDLGNSAGFIDTLLDDADSADFDPIAEINALEEELKKNPPKPREDDGKDPGDQDGTEY